MSTPDFSTTKHFWLILECILNTSSFGRSLTPSETACFRALQSKTEAWLEDNDQEQNLLDAVTGTPKHEFLSFTTFDGLIQEIRLIWVHDAEEGALKMNLLKTLDDEISKWQELNSADR